MFNQPSSLYKDCWFKDATILEYEMVKSLQTPATRSSKIDDS